MDRLTYPDIARIFGTGLIATGVGLLLFVAVTIVWGDPFTRLSEAAEQKTLSRELASSIPSDAQLESVLLDPALTSPAAALARKQTPLGDVAGRITIPAIDVRKAFIHGARDGTPDLTKGPGLYKESPFPGSGQPLAIAGHRTTYGAPFLNIDKLKPGDTIVLSMPYGRFTYTVTRQQVILPTDWSIINYGAAEKTAAQRNHVLRTRKCLHGTCEHLVLTACHPKYSASKRLAVFARLTGVRLKASEAAAA